MILYISHTEEFLNRNADTTITDMLILAITRTSLETYG
jgi:hypothetical protein